MNIDQYASHIEADEKHQRKQAQMRKYMESVNVTVRQGSWIGPVSRSLSNATHSMDSLRFAMQAVYRIGMQAQQPHIHTVLKDFGS